MIRFGETRGIDSLTLRNAAMLACSAHALVAPTADCQQVKLHAMVGIYQALGGGWR